MSKALAIGVAAFVLGNTLIDTETTLERAGDLHEHGSMLDAPQGTHQHGDEKDHHDAPTARAIKNYDSTSNYGVMGIPALIFFKDGKEVARAVGAMKRDRLLEEIRKDFGV